jgi:hypothetical protein
MTTLVTEEVLILISAGEPVIQNLTASLQVPSLLTVYDHLHVSMYYTIHSLEWIKSFTH